MPAVLEVVQGDLTALNVDAIVNAANERLAPGGGVCGAIHRAAGPELAAECAALGGCPTGEARITRGYDLPARHVVHTVGPVYGENTGRDAELLASCYRESLWLAAENGCESIAFPCISTGIFGYPAEEACRVAVAATRQWASGHELPRRVIFCCFGASDAELYAREIE